MFNLISTTISFVRIIFDYDISFIWMTAKEKTQNLINRCFTFGTKFTITILFTNIHIMKCLLDFDTREKMNILEYVSTGFASNLTWLRRLLNQMQFRRVHAMHVMPST